MKAAIAIVILVAACSAETAPRAMPGKHRANGGPRPITLAEASGLFVAPHGAHVLESLTKLTGDERVGAQLCLRAGPDTALAEHLEATGWNQVAMQPLSHDGKRVRARQGEYALRGFVLAAGSPGCGDRRLFRFTIHKPSPGGPGFGR